MLRRDLEAARSKWLAESTSQSEHDNREESGFLRFETDEGRADFHSLRHTFITHLVGSGVHPKLAKELARHSTITLTMDRYAHVGLLDMNTALESLPGLLDRPTTGEQRTLATGTDAFSVAPKVALDSVQLRNCQALSRVAGITVTASLDSQELLSNKAFRDVLTTREKGPAVGVEPTTPGLQNRCSAN